MQAAIEILCEIARRTILNCGMTILFVKQKIHTFNFSLQGTMFPCEHCDRAFQTFSSLRIHKANHHSNR